MLFSSSSAGFSSHTAANGSSRDFDAILAALTPDMQLPHLPAVASLNEFGSLHGYSALPSPKFENLVPAFANFNASLSARTIPALKASVALPTMTAPVMTRDYRAQDQDTPKPAAPLRAVTPVSPPIMWTVAPQPITPIRQAAAPEPASASSVPGIGASGDGEGQTTPSATVPLPPSSFAPLAPEAEAAPDEFDQSEQPTAGSTSLPRAAQSETPLSTSGNTTPRRNEEVVSTSQAPAETSRSVTSNSAAQQSTVRIAPGTALPQHVVDAIMAAAPAPADQPPATIPMNVTGSPAQPAPQRQTNNARSAAPDLPPAGTGSDRVVRTPDSANATTQVEANSTPAPKPAVSGSQQPVGRDANQTVSPSPAKPGDISLKALEPVVKASGANVTMRYDAPRSVPAEIEPDQIARPSPPAVANLNVSGTRQVEQSAQPRIAVADQAATPSSRIADAGVADTNPRPQQISASVESAEQPSPKNAVSETAETPVPVQSTNAPAPADAAAKPISVQISDPAAGDAKPETHQSPSLATLWNGAAKSQGDETDPESARAQTKQNPVAPASVNQVSKQLNVVVTDLEVADPGTPSNQQADMANSESAPVQAQQKPMVPAPADQIVKQQIADVAAPEFAKLDAVTRQQTGTAGTELAPAQTQQKPVAPPVEQIAKPQAAIVTDPQIANPGTADKQQIGTTDTDAATARTQQKAAVPASAEQISKPQPVVVADPEIVDLDAAAKPQIGTTDPQSTSAQTQQKPAVPAPADQIAKQLATVINPEIAEFDAAAEQQSGTTAPEPVSAQTQQKPTVHAAADQVSKPQDAAVTASAAADVDAQPANANLADTSRTVSADEAELADADSQVTQKPAPTDQPAPSAPERNADASKPQATTQAQPTPTAVAVIDPAEMLVSETASAVVTDDVPAQARGVEIKTVDGSSTTSKLNGSSSASPNAKPQASAIPGTAASMAQTTGDAGSDTSADNSATDDSATQSQTDSASGKVTTAQAAPSGPAVPVTPSANQPGGVTLAGVTQAVVAPNIATSAATTAASTSAAPATAEPTLDIDSLAVAIAANTARGANHFDIRLDPAELGRVDVHMSVSRDGKAEALITADRPETLELLQRDSKTLERALKDAGLDLSNNSLNFSLKGQHRQGDGGGSSMARMRSLSDAVVARAEAANASTPIWSQAPGSARLDIRV